MRDKSSPKKSAVCLTIDGGVCILATDNNMLSFNIGMHPFVNIHHHILLCLLLCLLDDE